MTDSQIKYQQLVEDQRHNLVMEKLGVAEQVSKRITANAADKQAEMREREWGLALGSTIASFLLPDANTVLKSGAQVVSSLMG